MLCVLAARGVPPPVRARMDDGLTMADPIVWGDASMEFRDLLAFVVVARLSSVSKAAAELHVAPSALSRRIKRLEQLLGVTLLERHPRGVAVSEVGALLLQKGNALHDQLKKIEREIQALGRRSAEDLRIAMPYGATTLFGAALVEKYRQLRPDVRLTLFERASSENRESLLRGDVHAAMAYECEPSPDIDVLPLTRERLVLVCPAAANGVAQRASVTPGELSALPLILPGPPHGYRRAVDRVARAAGIEPNIVLEVNGLAAMITMVQQRLGYAISTYAPLRAAVAAGTVTCLLVDSPAFEVELGLLQRRGEAQGRALTSFVSALRAVLASIGAPQHCEVLTKPAMPVTCWN
jgi:LysR family transcriptional regulator, nitrogen assimilation regulatory protein